MSSNYAGKLRIPQRRKRRAQQQILEPVTEVIPTSVPTRLSPRWSPTTKLLVGLVIVGLIAFLFIRFTSLITPLLIVFILTYLLHPTAILISNSLRITWRASVNILYLLILIILIGLLTLGGVGLVAQVQSVIGQIQTIVGDLPKYLQALSGLVFQIGPFRLDMRTVDFNAISQQLLALVQPLLGRTGTLVGTVASGAAEILGWTFFVLIVSYFVMIESNGLRSELFKIEIPLYAEDYRRLSSELGRIWNAFLRGQIFIVGFSALIYIFILSLLGVRYAIGIAIMAGLAKFLPYIGPGITWIVLALVTYFQPYKPFHVQPLTYVAIVVITLAVVDWIIDNLIAPRIMARSLRVHPAAVLVTALIAANLIGILGVVIAAPFLASLTLLARYTMRKMLDLDPWPRGESTPTHPLSFEWVTRARVLVVTWFQRNTPKEINRSKESSNEQQ